MPDIKELIIPKQFRHKLKKQGKQTSSVPPLKSFVHLPKDLKTIIKCMYRGDLKEFKRLIQKHEFLRNSTLFKNSEGTFSLLDIAEKVNQGAAKILKDFDAEPARYLISKPDLKLGLTAGMVKSMSDKFYNPKNQYIKEYLKLLPNISSSILDHDRYKDVRDYTAEFVLNRKFQINKILEDSLKKTDYPLQIISIGSGHCPLSMDLLYQYNDKVDKIIEVDNDSQIYNKEALYKKILPEDLSNKTKFCHADINSIDFQTKIEKAGYDPSKHTIVLIEGISYYIPKGTLSKLFKDFSGKGTETNYIFDYSQPPEALSDKLKPISHGLRDRVKQVCNIPGYSTYTVAEMNDLLKQCNAQEINMHPFTEIEKERTGENTFYINEDDNWGLVCQASI